MLQPTARRRVVVALTVYLALVARLTLWPAPAPSSSFDLVREVLAWLARVGVPITYAGLEAAANVVMFVPFGVLVGLLVRRGWLVVVLGLCLSAAIELTQLLLLPTRVPTVQDVVLNTLGAALGVLGLQAVRSVKARRRVARRPATSG
ncbi:VanZ family protein [Cellulomonas sp. URHE0023]|uniref:VanZ family protein n=1 Tax=Cellulomonas sp. URHE0023 TaxID=1380354 RepID=UPI000482A5F5|nr:VanZ family protein [Cellulomonas sp. URHE0023]